MATKEVREKGNQARSEQARKQIIGKKFGRLLITDYKIGTIKNKARVICKCDCGNIKIVNICNIKRGLTLSCGCLQKEKASQAQINHGMSGKPEYIIWCGIKARCFNENEPAYNRYGGRGITVCTSWLEKEYGFLNFFRDMGKRPSKKHSIDRINNDGNYEPSNCRWATAKMQAKNRRPGHLKRKRNKLGRFK